MMNVYYVSAQGERLNLTEWPYMINDSALRDYTWACEMKNGRISRLIKATSEYQIKLAITADSRKEYVEAAERLIEVVESDIARNVPGKLYFGNEYMTGFFYNSFKSDWNKGIDFMFNTLTFVTDAPFWIREQRYSFDQKSASFAGAFLNYPHDYSYDYSTSGSKKEIVNDHYGACDFEMNIFGPCVNPAITIGGHLYEVVTTVGEDEYLRIRSREGSVVKISKTGEQTNEFNSRNTDYSLFEKIQPGRSDVTWDGSFGFDITLFIERSEPEWTL